MPIRAAWAGPAGPLSPPAMTHAIPSRSMFPEGAQKRLDGQEADRGGRCLEMPDPGACCPILDGDVAPDVAGRGAVGVPAPQVAQHEWASLGQHLVGVPVRRPHRVEHPVDEPAVHILVEQVAHGVHEDHARLPPSQRLVEARRPFVEVEALLVGVPLDAAPALCEPLRVAEVAPARDFGAPGDRVPGRVGPFDGGFRAHGDSSCGDPFALIIAFLSLWCWWRCWFRQWLSSGLPMFGLWTAAEVFHCGSCCRPASRWGALPSGAGLQVWIPVLLRKAVRTARKLPSPLTGRT